MRSGAMAEEMILKRNTDCVYFLASPLTCKKGEECEFRHSEAARLNPIDCWYWFSGGCRNPHCAFRHPPIEVYQEIPPDPAPPSSAAPASKANVPCYFFFYTAYCMKGDQCPFSHGKVTPPVQKSPKEKPEAALVEQSQDKKIPCGSDAGLVLRNVHQNPSDCGPKSKELASQTHTECVPAKMPIDDDMKESSPSMDVSVSEHEEVPVKSDNNAFHGDHADIKDDAFSEDTSDDLVKVHSDPDESSAGFNVLVNNGLQRMGYEDHMMFQNGDHESRCHRHLLQYDYEHSTDYDFTNYPDDDVPQPRALLDSSHPLDNEYDADYGLESFWHSSGRRLDSEFFNRGRLLQREHEVEFRDPTDLRHRLGKRTRMNLQVAVNNTRKHHFSAGLNSSQRETLTRYGMSPPRLQSEKIRGKHRRRDSFVERSRQLWLHNRERDRHVAGQFTRENVRRTRQQRRHVLASEISKGTEANTGHADGFTGPKTLAQIKEEKNTSQSQRHASYSAFQAAK